VDAVFETLRIEDGRARLVDRHLARLTRSGVAPARVAQVEAVIASACGRPDHILRLDLNGDVVVERPRPIRPAAPVDLVAVVAYDPRGRIRERKAQDRSWADVIEAALADRDAGADRTGVGSGSDHSVGADREALLVDRSGRVGETTRANVFVIVDGAVVTPRAEGILAGVTRSWVIEQTGAEERSVDLAEVRRADAVFLSTAGRGIVAVRTVDGHPVPAHPLVAELARRWLALR
jgi:branched-chain amino acid aminotransferase